LFNKEQAKKKRTGFIPVRFGHDSRFLYFFFCRSLAFSRIPVQNRQIVLGRIIRVPGVQFPPRVVYDLEPGKEQAFFVIKLPNRVRQGLEPLHFLIGIYGLDVLNQGLTLIDNGLDFAPRQDRLSGLASISLTIFSICAETAGTPCAPSSESSTAGMLFPSRLARDARLTTARRRHSWMY
jgi:hypothetical protein